VSIDPAELLTQADIADIRASGRNPNQVVLQATYLRAGKKPTALARAPSPGDGIHQFQSHDPAALLRLHDEACKAGRLSAFVPASGSGTRLFHSLLQLQRSHETDLEHVRWRADRGDETARDALIVLENITGFAVWPTLERLGASPASLESILRALFGDQGPRYHQMPKGLIPFHVYADGVQTAVAEHLNESAAVTAGAAVCRVHFTISEKHRDQFEGEVTASIAHLERVHGVRFQVDFSVQSPATDTIAIDMAAGNIRRDPAGHIAFHAGGHGALLHNLHESKADVVLIKNIDNVARRELAPRIAEVRRLVSGLLLRIEKEVHSAIRQLRDGRGVQEALALLEREFGITPADGLKNEESRRQFAMSQLNRPLRVCGVVGALEHSGGRPFWMNTAGRGPTLQIVEGAEVDLDNPRERQLFHKSFYFNPVDIACSIRDADGQPFDLAAFASPERAFIAKKVLAGVPSLLYEHPGLWNGAMGLWNTVFVEIPDFAFNPVKSISDLWSSGHRRQ
jgi:hypothetical protein